MWASASEATRHNARLPGRPFSRPALAAWDLGVFLERNFVPVLEYTLFYDLPRFKYCDRVESVRLGAHAYAAAGTTSLYEGHGLTPAVIRAYREYAERNAMPLRMHAPVSMPTAAFDDKRLLDLFYHYAGPAGGRGRGDDILRVEGINLGGHADARVADIIAARAGTRTASASSGKVTSPGRRRCAWPRRAGIG